MTYSVDFRRKVLSIREQEGLSIKETAKRFHIGMDSLTRWLKRIEPQQKSAPRRRKLRAGFHFVFFVINKIDI